MAKTVTIGLQSFEDIRTRNIFFEGVSIWEYEKYR